MSLKIKGDFETFHGIEARGHRWVSVGRGKPLPYGSMGPISLLVSRLGSSETTASLGAFGTPFAARRIIETGCRRPACDA